MCWTIERLIQPPKVIVRVISLKTIQYSKFQGLEGYTLDLLDEISKAMHFDYEIVIASGNDYGAR